MKAHSTELKLSAVAQSVACGIGVAQAQSQPSFSYCHNNKVLSYSQYEGTGIETVRFLVDGNFGTGIADWGVSFNPWVHFTLDPTYVGKTLTKFCYWWSITSDLATLYSKIMSFDLYYHNGTSFVFYKKVTCSKTAVGTEFEEWDIAMPCPTGTVAVVVGSNYNTSFTRRGTEVAFGCWT